MAVTPEQPAYGSLTVRLVESVLDRGVSHAVLLMRHSAREYEPGRHDLLNPLTEDGRTWARSLGEALPKDLTLRGYASPPHRCMETAELVLAGHAAGGGSVTRHRPLDALGVFYALDQMKMWQGLKAAGGMMPYLSDWIEGRVPSDALIPADVASRLLLDVLIGRLRTPVAEHQLDVCVTHDMTLYLMRSCLLGEPPASAEVAYLDGMLLFESDGAVRLRGLSGAEMTVPGGGA